MRKLVLGFAVVLGGAMWAAVPAAASKPQTATGKFSVLTDTFAPIREADGNFFFLEHVTVSYDTGGLRGRAADTDKGVLYKNGSARAHGTEVCTGCTIGGSAPGNYTAVFNESFSGTGEYSGHLTFTHGSGGLAGLRGQGTFAGNDLGNTYSYNYSFGP